MKKLLTITTIVLCSFILMSGIVDLNGLFNYEKQETPTYISKDNSPVDNKISDKGATLGRVLFYDKQLSSNNTIACASCHLQEFAFGDTSVVSKGVNGVTMRHSMRLVNTRFSDETKAFWDKRASSIEDQASQPIKDHIEMGYSGMDGDSNFDLLIEKLENIDYYTTLFDFVYGSSEITELKIQKALAQFVRSIQSFDSKFDIGRAQVTNNDSPFPNFTDLENMGKKLFFTHPPLGGAGCARCHGGTEFSLISNSKNNGVIAVANDTTRVDLTNTKAPSLRDLVNPQGKMNGPFMHNGSLKTLMDVVDHYNKLEENLLNTNLDFRLSGNMHHLDLSQNQKDAIVAFLKTLTGSKIYTDEKWSNPFDESGNITVVPLEPNATDNINLLTLNIFPNPTSNFVNIQLEQGAYQLKIIDMNGKIIKSKLIKGNHTENMNIVPSGTYIFQAIDLNTHKKYSNKLIKK